MGWGALGAPKHVYRYVMLQSEGVTENKDIETLLLGDEVIG